MQVTCPNCGARYAVDPLAIGPVGRIVQCARCSHRWLQTVAAAKADAAREAVDAAMNSPETARGGAFSPEQPAVEPELQVASTGGNTGFSLGPARPTEPEEPVEAIPDLVIRPPRQRTSLPAVIEARALRRVPVKIVVALMVLAVVAAAAALAYVFRDDILPMLPPAWRTMLHLAP
jgi:predicted Zn finger-like uncharacterized protein